MNDRTTENPVNPDFYWICKSCHFRNRERRFHNRGDVSEGAIMCEVDPTDADKWRSSEDEIHRLI